MRIAVIGGGIAGLASAWGLNGRHEVVLFEAADWLGGHTHTVELEQDGREYAVDTGFIVFNDATYPHFIRLLKNLDISGQATDMSFSVADNGIEYASHSLSGLFAQPRNLVSPRHLRMIADILRFNRDSRELIGTDDGRTLAEYLESQKYSTVFQERYLFPLCAAIWSASIDEATRFPAEHFVRFFNNHGLLQLRDRPQWRVVPGGSHSYVRTMRQRLDARIRLNHPVQSVQREEAGVTVHSAAGAETFDKVVFACHSDQALALLADPSEREAEILGDLPYTDNDVILHTDASLLPRRRAAWASWNFRASNDPERPAAITYHMNRLQGIEAPVEFCVTLNQRDLIDPGSIRGEYSYAHPVYTPRSNRARARRDEISGQRNTYYCGAYWYNGFHEDGARSALDVSRALGGGW